MNKLSKLSLVLANSLMVIFFSFIGINEVSAVTITGFELRLGPNFTKCLGISGRSKADGAAANVYDCVSLVDGNDIEGRLSQMWYGHSSYNVSTNHTNFALNQFVNINSNKCLSLDGSNEATLITQRRYLQWGCIADHPYQGFVFYNFSTAGNDLVYDFTMHMFLTPSQTNPLVVVSGCAVKAYEYNEASIVNCDAPGYSGANSRWKRVPVTINF